jgi:hypothetical protein
MTLDRIAAIEERIKFDREQLVELKRRQDEKEAKEHLLKEVNLPVMLNLLIGLMSSSQRFLLNMITGAWGQVLRIASAYSATPRSLGCFGQIMRTSCTCYFMAAANCLILLTSIGTHSACAGSKVCLFCVGTAT